MRFLADMGVSVRVIEWLKESGHDAVHLRDEGLQRLPNGEILLKAAREQRVVLTFDLDFGEIIAASRGSNVSVVVFRLRNTRSAHVIDRLNSVLQECEDELNRGDCCRRREPASRAAAADWTLN